MKKIILPLCVAIAAVAMIAATYTPPSVGTVYLGPFNGGTNNIAATSTNTYTTAVIDVNEFDNVGYRISIKPISTSTGTVVFSFSDGIGNTYESTASRTVTVTLSGTNTIETVGNFQTPGSGQLMLGTITSTNAMAMTNIVVQLNKKSPLRRSR